MPSRPLHWPRTTPCHLEPFPVTFSHTSTRHEGPPALPWPWNMSSDLYPRPGTLNHAPWPWPTFPRDPEAFQTAGSSVRLIRKSKVEKRCSRSSRRHTSSNDRFSASAATCQVEPTAPDSASARKWITFTFSRRQRHRRDAQGEGQPANSVEGQVQGHGDDLEMTLNNQRWLDVDLLRNDVASSTTASGWTATILASCSSADSERPHRCCCHLPNKVENIEHTPDISYTLQWPGDSPQNGSFLSEKLGTHLSRGSWVHNQTAHRSVFLLL